MVPMTTSLSTTDPSTTAVHAGREDLKALGLHHPRIYLAPT